MKSTDNEAHNEIEQLMQEQMEYRLTLDSLPKQMKFRLKDYCNVTKPSTRELQRLKACAFCDRSKDRITTKVYARLICKGHFIKIYSDSFEVH